MSPARRRQMVDREHPSLSCAPVRAAGGEPFQHPSLSLVRQCALLGVSRSSIYYHPKDASAEDLSLMG